MKRILSLLIVLALLIVQIPNAFADGTMPDAILMLSSILSRSESIEYEIDDVIDAFGQFGNADRAIEFKFYSTMIKYVIDTNWYEAQNYITVLETMNFDDYLAGDAFPEYMISHGITGTEYMAVRPVAEVKLYVAGRIAYSEGRKNDAYTSFLTCYNFYDAADYLLKLMDQIGVQSLAPTPASAVEITVTSAPAEMTVTPAPVEAATPTEKKLPAPPEITGIQTAIGLNTITWTPVEGAVSYSIIQYVNNGEQREVYNGKETKGRDETVRLGVKYTYVVVATLSDGTKVSSEEKTIFSATQAPANNNSTPAPQAHTHTWTAADCTHPKTCSSCGATEGSALGHNWKAADCTHAKTCSRCGATDGSALGHDWKAADCTHAKTCSRCGATDGSALGHDWKPATESTPKTCSRCGATEGSKLTWGDWSNWSSTSVSASSTRQVETRTVYNYYRWHYYNTKHNSWYNHYNEYTGSEYKAGSGEWQYKTTTSPLDYAGTVGGHQYYSGYWYLQSTSTEYRYRDLK